MSQRLLNGLAWTLLALTVVLLAANVVLGLTSGVAELERTALEGTAMSHPAPRDPSWR